MSAMRNCPATVMTEDGFFYCSMPEHLGSHVATWEIGNIKMALVWGKYLSVCAPVPLLTWVIEETLRDLQGMGSGNPTSLGRLGAQNVLRRPGPFSRKPKVAWPDAPPDWVNDANDMTQGGALLKAWDKHRRSYTGEAT